MNLKQLIGNSAYWTINKQLSNEIGLEATLLLQHLIDLEQNYFDGEFWQTSEKLQESVFLSKYLIKKAITVLEDKGYIKVENKVPANSTTISKVYHFYIVKENIAKAFNQQQPKDLTNVSKKSLPTKVKEFNQVDKENNNKENTNKISDVSSNDDRLVRIENLYWKKLVPAYPTNRIGNRQHGIKKWLQLEERDMVLAIKNLDRYLKVAGTYVKSLQNYLTERCFAEEWLKAEEETKTKQQNTNNKSIGTKTFTSNYENF